MNPGNWVTNISGGVKLGLALLRVIALASVMAMRTQVLAAKLSIATRKGVAQFCRERSSGPVVVPLWAVAELAIIATDMAEITGAAIGSNLIFSLPLWAGSVLAAVSSLTLLGVRTACKREFHWAELIIMSLVGVIALALVFEVALARPTALTVTSGFIPAVPGTSTLYIAIGTLGATVIPHSVYLHPYIIQNRHDRLIESDDDTGTIYCHYLRLERLDAVVALLGAMFVNAAMLIVAIAAPQRTGIETLEEAYVTLSGVFGANASLASDVALITVGLSSSFMVTVAGQTVMDGFLGLDINVQLRRSVVPVPSLLIATMGFDPTSVLVTSQIALSFELPLVLIPLLWFTHKASLMGNLRNQVATTGVLGAAIVVIVALNGWLLCSTLLG